MKVFVSVLAVLFASVAIVGASFGGNISLPWSSSLDCANWENVVNGGTPSCTDFQVWLNSNVCGHYSMITTAANRPGSTGGGIRQYVAPGDNAQTNGLAVTFAPQSSIWVRWYEKYGSGFSFSTLNYHKDVRVMDTNLGSFMIAEPTGSTYRVGWYDGATGANNAINGSGVGWSKIGDGNWHLYELHVTQSGTIQMWIDEQKIIDGSTGRTFSAGWNGVLFGDNFSTVSSNCVPVDWDDMAISNTGYIGPMGGGTTPTPPPPTPTPTATISESFEDLNWAARGWYDNTAHGVLETSGCYSKNCLKWAWPAGATTPTNGQGVRKLFTPTEQVFLRYYVKVDPNWVGSGVSYHPHMIQIMSDQDGQYQGPAYSNLDAYFELNGNPPVPMFGIQDSVLINTSQGSLPNNLVGITENRDLAGCNGDFGDPGTMESCYQSGSWLNGRMWRESSSVTKGAWHKLEYYLKMNTITNNRANADGILQVYIDGKLTTSKSNMAYRTAQQPTKKFSQLFLGPYIGPGSPIAQNMWIDELQIFNTNQGGGGGGAPAVPTGLTVGP